MVVTFDNYRYIGPNKNSTNRVDYQYNKDYLQSLINKGQYFQAAEYAKQYVPIDPVRRTGYYQQLNNLRTMGKQYQATINRAKAYGQDTYNKFEFITGLKQGIDTSNNPLSKQYNELKRRLGSAVSYNDGGMIRPTFSGVLSALNYLNPFTDNRPIDITSTNDQTKSTINKEAEYLEFRFKPEASTYEKVTDYTKNMGSFINANINPINRIITPLKNRDWWDNVKGIISDGFGNSIQDTINQKIAEQAGAIPATESKTIKERLIDLFGQWNGFEKNNYQKTDNDVLESLGITKDDLVNNGLEIQTLKDGTKAVKFNKSNPLADKLIHNYLSNKDLLDTGGIIGYDVNGNAIDSGAISDYEKALFNLNQKAINTQMHDLISNALYDTNVIESMKFVEQPKQYTGTIAGPIFDELAPIYSGGNMTEDQAKALNHVLPYVYNTLKSLGSNDIEMYATGLSESGDGNTLKPVESAEDRERIMTTIASKDIKDMGLEAYVSNGIVGTLITFTGDAKKPDDLNANTPITENTNTRRYQVFIPGLFEHEAQAKLDRDTSANGAKEVADMKNYGYNYTTMDNVTISPDANTGEFTKTYKVNGKNVTEFISQEEANRYIVKDKIIERAAMELPMAYMNSDGAIINQKAFENQAKIIAFQSNFELYPDQTLVDNNGQEYTIENFNDIFDRSKVRRDNTRADMWLQIEDIRDIFTSIMLQLRNYN